MSAHGLHTLATALHKWRVPLLPGLLLGTMRVLYRAHLSVEAEIGRGTTLAYGGLGVAIDPGARIGRGCVIGEYVSMSRGGDLPGAPVVEDFVTIESGAALCGGVRIGRGALIRANVHVRCDVPEGAVIERDLVKPLVETQRMDAPRSTNAVQQGGEPLFPREPEQPEKPPADDESVNVPAGA